MPLSSSWIRLGQWLTTRRPHKTRWYVVVRAKLQSSRFRALRLERAQSGFLPSVERWRFITHHFRTSCSTLEKNAMGGGLIANSRQPLRSFSRFAAAALAPQSSWLVLCRCIRDSTGCTYTHKLYAPHQIFFCPWRTQFRAFSICKTNSEVSTTWSR